MEEVGRLTRAAGLIGFLTLLSRVMGLVRDIVVGYLFGAHGVTDAFFVAFRIPNLLRRLTAEGALTTAFVPVFTDYLTHRGAEETRRVARIVFTFIVLVLGVVTFLGIVFAGPLTHLFAPGFSDDAEKFALTVLLTRLMFPYIFFVSLVALAMGILNSLRHFIAPALSPVLLNVSIIVCAVLLYPVLDQPVIGLGVGVLVGGIAQLLLQLPYLARFGYSFSADFAFRHPALRRLLFLMTPATFGAAVYQINVLVSTILASLLPEGSVSYLYYADRLFEFPLGIFAVALGTAALPSFSSLAAQKEFPALKEALVYGLRLVNFISLPATVGLMVISVPVFSVLFQRGAFDTQATLGAASALVYFSFGLWGVSGSKLVVPVFYALQDAKTPVWVSFFCFILNFVLSLMFMGELSGATGWGTSVLVALSQHLSVLSLSHAGLALATSVSATVNFLLLLLILQRRLGGIPWREFLASFARDLAAALAMGGLLFIVVQGIDWVGSAALWQGAALLLVLVLGVLLYLFFCFLLRSPEWPLVRQLSGRLLRKLF